MESPLLALPLILLLLTACSSTGEPVNSTNQTGSPITLPPDDDPTAPPVSPSEDDARWERISSTNVEEQCLAQSQAEASSMGYPSFMIEGCACDADEGVAVKAYDCVVDAIDGEHPVSIRCIKAESRCLITSEQGSLYLTFEELEALIG